ncbi:hypothetical protein MTP03_32560 [Tsukamurella sp. PLM1]|nr:hypothetical protein MTP03_32560 [Tsukamurella sp. PLM1]
MFRSYLRSSPFAGENLFGLTCNRRPILLIEDGALTQSQTDPVMELASIVDAKIRRYRIDGSGRRTSWRTVPTLAHSTDSAIRVPGEACRQLVQPAAPSKRELAALGPLLLAARLGASVVVRAAGDDGAANLDPYCAFARPSEFLPILAHYGRMRGNTVCLPSMGWADRNVPLHQFYPMYYAPVVLPQQARLLGVCQSMSAASGDPTLVRLAATLQIRLGRALAGFDALLAALSSPPTGSPPWAPFSTGGATPHEPNPRSMTS